MGEIEQIQGFSVTACAVKWTRRLSKAREYNKLRTGKHVHTHIFSRLLNLFYDVCATFGKIMVVRIISIFRFFSMQNVKRT